MLSVLIPTYNYNVYPLVKEIHKQLTKQGIDFEILVYDDASTKTFKTNHLLNDLQNVIHKRFETNQGRTKMRDLLANDAKFEMLLFLDADMFPKDRFFIAKYLKEIEKNKADVYFGGLQVAKNPPDKNKILRWKYGKERESLSIEMRQKFPYRSIISGALTINRKVFLQVSEKLKNLNRYGLDIYFSYLLKKQNIKVKHFNNPIIHLGLEDSEKFLLKTRKAVETLKFLVSNEMISKDYSKLSKTGYQLKKIRLCFPVEIFLKIFRKLILNNLLSKTPSLRLFDLYKLYYFCQNKNK